MLRIDLVGVVARRCFRLGSIFSTLIRALTLNLAQLKQFTWGLGHSLAKCCPLQLKQLIFLLTIPLPEERLGRTPEKRFLTCAKVQLDLLSEMQPNVLRKAYNSLVSWKFDALADLEIFSSGIPPITALTRYGSGICLLSSFNFANLSKQYSPKSCPWVAW